METGSEFIKLVADSPASPTESLDNIPLPIGPAPSEQSKSPSKKRALSEANTDDDDEDGNAVNDWADASILRQRAFKKLEWKAQALTRFGNKDERILQEYSQKWFDIFVSIDHFSTFDCVNEDIGLKKFAETHGNENVRVVNFEAPATTRASSLAKIINDSMKSQSPLVSTLSRYFDQSVNLQLSKVFYAKGSQPVQIVESFYENSLGVLVAVNRKSEICVKNDIFPDIHCRRSGLIVKFASECSFRVQGSNTESTPSNEERAIFVFQILATGDDVVEKGFTSPFINYLPTSDELEKVHVPYNNIAAPRSLYFVKKYWQHVKKAGIKAFFSSSTSAEKMSDVEFCILKEYFKDEEGSRNKSFKILPALLESTDQNLVRVYVDAKYAHLLTEISCHSDFFWEKVGSELFFVDSENARASGAIYYKCNLLVLL